MRKNLLFFLSLSFLLTPFLTGCGVTNTISTNQYIEGYWGRWQTPSYWGYHGSPGSFIVYNPGYLRDNHPSNFCFRITINNFNKDSLPKEEWRNYYGTIEYHTVSRPTDYKYASKVFVQTDLDNLSKVGNYLVKRSAQIKVFKKKNGSYTYNILFDDVGFGVSIPWQHAK